MRGEPDYLHEDWLTKSAPIHMANVIIGHPITDEKKNLAFFNLLNNFNIGITLSSLYLLSFIGILVCSFLLNRLAYRVQFGRRRRKRAFEISKRIALLLGKFRKERFTAVGLFVAAIHLFLWWTILFLTNNIKTNKVVVDTSQLVKNADDILSSPKIVCMLEHEPLMTMILSSHNKQSVLWRVYEKTRLRPGMAIERLALNNRDRCLVNGDTYLSRLLKSEIM